jgi:hypothetical protein
MKYPKQRFKKVIGAVRRKIFSLTDFSGSGSLGEGEIIAQLKVKFHIRKSE